MVEQNQEGIGDEVQHPAGTNEPEKNAETADRPTDQGDGGGNEPLGDNEHSSER